MIFFQRIFVEANDRVVLQFQTGVPAAQEESGEAIIDINSYGNWVAGIELLSVFVGFSLERAVRPFRPVPISVGTSYPPGAVTYEKDNGDEMVYMYLLYEDAVISLPKEERSRLLKIDHQIQNPLCRFGLDGDGGLIYAKLPMADLSSPPETLLALLKK